VFWQYYGGVVLSWILIVGVVMDGGEVLFLLLRHVWLGFSLLDLR
jgi:hypothetical protein